MALTPDQHRKTIFLSIIGAIGLFGLFIIHNTAIVKDHTDETPNDDLNEDEHT
jgi:hypothetical protein